VGHSARTIPLGSVEQMVAAVSKDKPDVVCISGLPPYALSYERAAYKSLRALRPERETVIGLWGYTGDAAKAAREITSGQMDHICTTLAQAILDVGRVAQVTLPHGEVSLL
jgi:hypothetical protein